MMKRLAPLFLTLLLAAVALVGLSLPAAAAPAPQAVYNTPTPRPDGRIIYMVKQGDTCIKIALLHKITEEQLRNLNNIRGTNCIVQLGQEVLIGYAGPAESPTPGPSTTPTSMLPTPTPLPGKGIICVVLFNDVNGNGLLEDTETALVGGQVSMTSKDGAFSKTGSTLESLEAPLCFENALEGEYNISIAVPQGYNSTTSASRSVKLMAGDTSTLDFGAQISLKAPPAAAAANETTNRIPLFGLLGVVFIAAGVGLAVYMRRVLK